MKIGKVVESCGERDLQNGGVSLFKQFYSLFQSQIVEVFHYGHVHVFFEKTHKVIFAEIALGSETGNRKRLVIEQMDLVQYGLLWFRGVCGVDRSFPVRGTVLQEQENNLQQ